MATRGDSGPFSSASCTRVRPRALARAYAGSDSSASRVTPSERMKADASRRKGYFARADSSTAVGTHSRLKAFAGEARTRPTAAGRRSFCDPMIGESVGEIQGYFAVHSQGLGHATRAVALARGMQDGREDLYFLFLAGVTALDLVVASGFDARPAPPAPHWPATDGVIRPSRAWHG